ncbi:MAG: 7TM diverse intracellular signaling domain-containing protein [Bacteroidota bacterium]
MCARCSILMILLGSFAFSLDAWATDTLQLQFDNENYLLEPQYFEILSDPEHALSIEDVILPHYAQQFHLSDDPFPHPEDLDHTYWIRFQFGGEAIYDNNWYLEVLCQTTTLVEFYYPDESGSYHQRSAGMQYPFAEREILHKNFVFDLPATQKYPTCYLKIKTENPVHFLFKIRSDNYFIRYSLTEYFVLGLFYGILLIMGIYNLVLYFSIRERFYLYYVLYVISCMLISFEDGLAFQYIWPNHPELNQFFYRYSPAIFLLCFTAYANAFLELDQAWPRFYRWFLGLVGFSIVYFVVREQVTHEPWAIPVYLIPFLVLYGASIWRWRSGFPAARFFILAFSFTIVGVIITALRRNASLEWDNLALVYTLNYGLVLEVVFLSVAQGEKFRLAKRSEEAAQQTIIQNLQEVNQIKEAVNQEIERKVELQTSEIIAQKNLIEQQNEQLAAANRKLQSQAEEISRINQLLDVENQELRGNVKELTRARVFAREVDFGEFQSFFPDDEACYAYLERLKWENGYQCHRCGNDKYTKGQGHLARRCTKCGTNESATAHTLFHRLHFPILKGFYLLFLVYANKGNISATELSEIVDLRYQTCWKFSKKVQDKLKQVSAGEEPDTSQNDGWSHLILQ